MVEPPPTPIQPKRPSLGPGFETYAELERALPRDPFGNIDFVRAVKEGLIDPKPGPEPDAPAAPVLPYDVVMDPGVPLFRVVFPHDVHTFWLTCDSCHPSIFQMRAGANPITMQKIFAGEYCGRCHGRVAFPPQTSCPRCHVDLGRASG